MLPDPDPAATELRLRRLEDSLANLQNAEWLAEHVAERVSARLEHHLANGALPQVKAAEVPAEAPVAEPAKDSPSWFLPELVREIRAMVHMFRDVRYHVNPLTWVVVLFTLPAALLTHFWFPFLSWIPVAGTILDKLFALTIAFIGFKALSREARRYQRFRGTLE